MFRPYSEREKTETHTTYVFKSIYAWLLYGLVALCAIGYLLESYPVMGLGTVWFLFYLLIISTQYIGINRRIRKATAAGSVEMSGSKWSFSNPLTVKLPNEHT